ncbi:MAG: hypothetical protein K8I03_03030 [Ignavibacteria bacterium]|nr:hypothetical protein [Ignavibacteria bacterium]
MRIRSIFAALIVMVCSVLGQEFKEVKTAQDVVDNYMLSIGGESAIRNVESVFMKGTIESPQGDGTIEVYLSKLYLFMDVVTPQFQLKQALDFKSKKGWVKLGDKVTDMKEEEIVKNLERSESSMWGNFLDAGKKGITYELLQNENYNDIEVYVVDIKKDGNTITTSYFNTKNFNKLKEMKDGTTTEYSDFRKVGSSGVYMAHKLITALSDVTTTEIEFNTKFDKKLLKKPIVEVK